MKKIVSLSLLAMAALLSCTEEVKPKPFTYSQILTGATKKTWKLDYFVTRVVGKEDTGGQAFAHGPGEADAAAAPVDGLARPHIQVPHQHDGNSGRLGRPA